MTVPLPVLLAVMLLGIVLLALGVRAERRQHRGGYISPDKPVTRLPRVRPGPGPGGRRPR